MRWQRHRASCEFPGTSVCQNILFILHLYQSGILKAAGRAVGRSVWVVARSIGCKQWRLGSTLKL